MQVTVDIPEQDWTEARRELLAQGATELEADTILLGEALGGAVTRIQRLAGDGADCCYMLAAYRAEPPAGPPTITPEMVRAVLRRSDEVRAAVAFGPDALPEQLRDHILHVWATITPKE